MHDFAATLGMSLKENAVDDLFFGLIYLNSSASRPWLACLCVPFLPRCEDAGKAVKE